MNIDFSRAWTSLQRLLNGMIALLPRLVLGAIVFGVFLLLARLVRLLVSRYTRRFGHDHNLERVLSRLGGIIVIVLGALVALSVTFPSFTPDKLVGVLGISSVAIGFAFKDIFQNFLAGILILLTRPFRVGDQIVFEGFEGAVEDIQTRATYIKTYDGRRVVIPNGELYTKSVTVNTAFPVRRMEYDVGIGYGDDIDTARAIILQVMRDAPNVEPDPKADVIVVKLADSTVNLRARYWCKSTKVQTLEAQDQFLTAVKNALTAAGIDLPFPTQQILFHDQTETTDGDRARQREGWPAGDKPVPGPRVVRCEAPPSHVPAVAPHADARQQTA